MRLMTAVTEVPVLEPVPLWPVANLPAYSWLRLWDGCNHDEVGLFMYALANYGADEDEAELNVTETLRTIAERELLILPGGLYVKQGDAIVHPGCCSGLEDWREWYFVPDGVSPFMGHDPWPGTELVDGLVRIHADQDSPVHVDISLEQLQTELESVR